MPSAGQGKLERAVGSELVLMDPELEEAVELEASLDPELAAALKRASSTLKGEAGETASRSDVLNLQVRHQLIIRLKAQGMMEDRIARAVGVTKRTVQRVVENYWKLRRIELDQQDMDNFVLLIAEGYLEDIDRLTDIVRSSSHVSAVVGAIKTRQEARQKYVDLLADFGFLKRRPTEVEVKIDGADTNILVIDPEMFKVYTKDLLAQKRLARGELSDDDADERIADFVVGFKDEDVVAS